MKINCSDLRVCFRLCLRTREREKSLSFLPSCNEKQLFLELDPSQTEAMQLLPSYQVIDSFSPRVLLSLFSPLISATTYVRLAKFKLELYVAQRPLYHAKVRCVGSRTIPNGSVGRQPDTKY